MNHTRGGEKIAAGQCGHASGQCLVSHGSSSPPFFLGGRLMVAKSNATAGCLALLLGPVGLWYKGCWAAGFAWLVMAILIAPLTGFLTAPLFWIGMTIHAILAEPRQ